MIRKTITAIAASLLVFSPLAGAADIEIAGAEFGLFEEGKGNEILFQPSNIVPLAIGQRYGWIIEVRTLKRTLAVREEYVLPKAASDKEPDSAVAKNLHIPDLRRSQVSQRQLALVDGQIIGEWSIGPGEPPGKRRLQVIVEGQVAATFDYEVK
jgi:hypothetical protein